MGTPCKIKIRNNLYYKHYDGYNGGIALSLLNSIVGNKICLNTFIEIGKLEKCDMVKNKLYLYDISETQVNNIPMLDFLRQGIDSLLYAEQRLYDRIKEEDNRTAYFSKLRGDSEEMIKDKMRLSTIFKNGYPIKEHFKKEYDLIEKIII